MRKTRRVLVVVLVIMTLCMLGVLALDWILDDIFSTMPGNFDLDCPDCNP